MRATGSVTFLLAVMIAGGVGAGPSLSGTGIEQVRPTALRLAEFEFDPLLEEPQLPEGWDRSADGRADLHLVQFDGPITDETLERLRSKGLEPVQYVHPDSFIVWGRRIERRGLDATPSVRWTGDFAPAFRVQPQWRNVSGALDVKILLYRLGDIETAIDSLVALGGRPGERRVVNRKLEVIAFTLPGESMQLAAAIPGVYSIQVQPTDFGSRGEVSAQINAGNVDASNMALPGYPAWLSGVGLDGNGVTVAHVDEGVDETHPDLAASMLGCTGTTCSLQGSVHGTHTAGIIVGDGSSLELDANGFLRGLGVAPGAGLIEQRYFPTLLEPGGLLELMTQSSRNGAVISSNSWGASGSTLGYDINTLLVDAGVRDADPETPGNQPLIYVQAIENGNGGLSTQGVPDEGKNILTVGSSVAVAGDGNQDPNINNVSSNSAHGPALDGRTIPHLVAPGCFVDSTFPTGAPSQHGAQCGTSMAAPQVAGAVALFVEHYRGLAGTTGDPSPALVKSAFLPVAHDLEGGLDANGIVLGHRPDSRQGWGRLDLAAVVDPDPGSALYFDQSTIFEGTGQEWLRVVTPVDPAKPMRVMMAFTDAPGHGLGGNTPAWNNDLDLVVEVDGNSYLGNVFGGDGFSTTGGAADTMNNAEGVFLQGLTGSEVTLRVVAANINSDGVPNLGDETDQDFALTCYNCSLVPAFALNPAPGSRNLCAPAEATFLIDVEQIAGYSGAITLSAIGVPAGATASFDTNPVTPGGSAWLTISDTANALTGDYLIEVQGGTVDLSRSTRVLFDLRAAPPSPALPTLPLDNAVDVEPRPVLQWDPSPWASHYVVEIAVDAGFETIVYSALSDGASHEVGNLLNQQATYFWRVRATNACGFGDFSTVSSFTTRDVPPVLLVDDDWDIPDVSNEFKRPLNDQGVSFDLWDVYAEKNGLEPDAATISRYDTVIWFTGEEEVFAGPDSATEAGMEHWLDRGGCLLVSSPDYILNGDFDSFVQERFGVESVVEDTGMNVVTGQSLVFNGLGPWALSNVQNDYSDALTPDATAEVAFSGDLGNAAVQKDAGSYRTTFHAYGIERIPGNPENQRLTLERFLNWCAELPPIDGDLDGVPNSLDCVAADPGVWTSPGQIDDLMLDKNPSAQFTWTRPASGSGAVYDVLRSEDNTDFYNATCVAAGVTATQAPGDADPGPAQLFFYLAGARNDCGTSTLGQNRDGTPRYGTACE